MDILPDSKDWTWVLDRPCPECGLDTRLVEPKSVADRLRTNSAALLEVLSTTPEPQRRRVPHRWSTLEYACHVRDVFVLFDQRLGLMLVEDDPLFANWDQDRTAVEERYGEQDPVVVGVQLQEAASRLARHFEEVDGVQWQRRGRRSDGATFTVATFSRYFIHDPVHHLYDVTRAELGGEHNDTWNLANEGDRLMSVIEHTTVEPKPTWRPPAIYPRLGYEDEWAALEFLVQAFGFRERREARQEHADGHMLAWLEHGDGVVMVGHTQHDVHGIHSPRETGAATCMLNVAVDDVDAHCRRAVAAGALITVELGDASFGERRYEAEDPEGNRWHFGESLASVGRRRAQAENGQ